MKILLHYLKYFILPSSFTLEESFSQERKKKKIQGKYSELLHRESTDMLRGNTV